MELKYNGRNITLDNVHFTDFSINVDEDIDVLQYNGEVVWERKNNLHRVKLFNQRANRGYMCYYYSMPQRRVSGALCQSATLCDVGLRGYQTKYPKTTYLGVAPYINMEYMPATNDFRFWIPAGTETYLNYPVYLIGEGKILTWSERDTQRFIVTDVSGNPVNKIVDGGEYIIYTKSKDNFMIAAPGYYSNKEGARLNNQREDAMYWRVIFYDL